MCHVVVKDLDYVLVSKNRASQRLDLFEDDSINQIVIARIKSFPRPRILDTLCVMYQSMRNYQLLSNYISNQFKYNFRFVKNFYRDMAFFKPCGQCIDWGIKYQILYRRNQNRLNYTSNQSTSQSPSTSSSPSTISSPSKISSSTTSSKSSTSSRSSFSSYTKDNHSV